MTEPEAKFVEAVVDVDQLVPSPRNPRRHSPEQMDMLEASIRRFGQPRPILARAQNRMIIAGHGVHEACRRAGVSKVRVVLWNVDQEQADQFMLADNRLGTLGKDDADRMRDLLREIQSADLSSLGFTVAQRDDLFERVSDSDLQVSVIETAPVYDRFWISVRGPLAIQADTLLRLQTLLGELPEIEIELGTVSAG